MKLTKEQLQKIIQEEFQDMLNEQFKPDFYYPRLEDDMGPEELNMLSAGIDPYDMSYDPYAAPEGYQVPYDPSTAEPLYRGYGEGSATMEPDWLETVRANQAAQDAETAAATERLLDPGPEGPTEEQVRNELIRQAMENR